MSLFIILVNPQTFVKWVNMQTNGLGWICSVIMVGDRGSHQQEHVFFTGICCRKWDVLVPGPLANAALEMERT